MKRLSCSLLLIYTTLYALAQVVVEAKIDSTAILIGEQAHISLSVTMNDGDAAQFPMFKPNEMLTPGVEVLDMTDCDTTKLDNNKVKLSRQYTITSFDDTLYYLPPMRVNVGGKDYQSKNLALKVLTIEVDTLHPNQYFPPKSVQNNPFDWNEWKKPFWMSLLFLALLALAGYLYKRLKENKPVISKIRIIRRLLPHQKAMKEIERIKAERIDVSEDQKEYYTRLTDALRTYLEERFGFNAMEMTSGEIVEQLKLVDDQSKIDELRCLLETADLVKFAKYSTMLNEKDRDMASVVEFIQTTKRDDMPTIEKIKPQLSEGDKRSRRSRIIIKTAITLATIAAVVILAYVIWSLAMLLD